MSAGRYSFDRFLLDAGDRRLLGDGSPIDINSRYLDALALLVREQGRLVSKDRFLEEVWAGVPVTDEALTQCIRTLRRQLGDDAARPRFIETVPKHGYRFIAPVEKVGAAAEPVRRAPARGFDWTRFAVIGTTGTVGGGMAGFVGGLIYGFAAASHPETGTGALSAVLVIQCLTIAAALMGGAGVSFAIAAVIDRKDWRWTVLAGAGGGLLVGGLVKLLGVDAFHLLFGDAPAGITGAGEGAMLGAGVGLSAWIVHRSATLRRGLVGAAAAGGAAGLLVTMTGGRLMGGSLDLLSRTFPGSHLRLDAIGALAGEQGFGPVAQMFTASLEGALFSACVAAAMVLGQRSRGRQAPRNLNSLHA